MRGRRFLNLASMRSYQRFPGSLQWQSAEIIRYLSGSSGRAVRFHPGCPGVSSRQRLGSLIWLMSAPAMDDTPPSSFDSFELYVRPPSRTVKEALDARM